MLTYVFENFRNNCIKIYKLHPAHFLSASGLAWQACLKKTWVKLEFLSDVDITGGICHAIIHKYEKANNKYMINYNKNIESSLMYLDANNLYGWGMSPRLSVIGFI